VAFGNANAARSDLPDSRSPDRLMVIERDGCDRGGLARGYRYPEYLCYGLKSEQRSRTAEVVPRGMSACGWAARHPGAQAPDTSPVRGDANQAAS
jgi:hypothetical protein